MKKQKGMNEKVAARISYSKYKDVFLNSKCLRHSMNSKNHNIRINETNKISLLYFHDKKHILNNGYDEPVFGYESCFKLVQHETNITLITTRNGSFVKISIYYFNCCSGQNRVFFVKLQKYCFNSALSRTDFFS